MSRIVLIPVAQGSEEIEAVTLIDLLRRAGLEVVVPKPVERALDGLRPPGHLDLEAGRGAARASGLGAPFLDVRSR